MNVNRSPYILQFLFHLMTMWQTNKW